MDVTFTLDRRMNIYISDEEMEKAKEASLWFGKDTFAMALSQDEEQLTLYPVPNGFRGTAYKPTNGLCLSSKIRPTILQPFQKMHAPVVFGNRKMVLSLENWRNHIFPEGAKPKSAPRAPVPAPGLNINRLQAAVTEINNTLEAHPELVASLTTEGRLRVAVLLQ